MVIAVSPARPDVAQQPAHPADISWDAWERGVRASLKKPARTRFTVDKARRLITYTQTTSVWWQLMVVIVSPVPGLLTSLLAPLIPLQEPALGVAKNPGYLIHFVVTFALCMSGAILQARSVCEISHSDYPTHLVAAVATTGTLLLLGCAIGVSYAWRYPVPFSFLVLAPPWTACLLVAHALVLRAHLRRASYVRRRLFLYLQSMSVQVSQVVIYSAYAAALDSATTRIQIVLVAAFPLLKFAIRRLILALSHQLGAYGHEVAVFNVEVCGTMYQAVILQNSPSPVVSALLIGIDVLQGLLYIRIFLDQKAVVPTFEILLMAAQLIQSGEAAKHPPVETVVDGGTAHFSIVSRLVDLFFRIFGCHSNRVVNIQPRAEERLSVVPRRNKNLTHQQSKRRTLLRALECWHDAETILLVEYLEVVLPFINIVYVAIVARLDSARYNTQLREFHTQPASLQAAIANIMFYVVLQAATLVVIAVVIRVRYRISPLAMLAFALENRVWSFQGRMIGWLPATLAFPVVHSGSLTSYGFLLYLAGSWVLNVGRV